MSGVPDASRRRPDTARSSHRPPRSTRGRSAGATNARHTNSAAAAARAWHAPLQCPREPEAVALRDFDGLRAWCRTAVDRREKQPGRGAFDAEIDPVGIVVVALAHQDVRARHRATRFAFGCGVAFRLVA